MGFEIDFLPVGEGEKCGDAIAVRYGEPGAYTVVIYDGGTLKSGKDLVRHVREHYQTNFVAHVVNSHPDQDHASGLSVVLEELDVGTLWMHRPWLHSHLILDYFRDGRITNQSLKQRLQIKMSAAYNLEQIAARRRIQVVEPFQGTQIGSFFVLSPDKDWYTHVLIADFEKSPEQMAIDSAALAADRLGFRAFLEGAKAAVTKWIPEQWNIELLREDVETSAENESSVILYTYMASHEHGILLTGDAGVRALSKALDYLDSNNISASQSIKFFQIPHHGGRHNVSPSVLNRLVGPRMPTIPQKTDKTAFVSASKDSDYPRRMVRNAFLRRGAKVVTTKGSTIHHYRDMPNRGWSAAELLEFSHQVEAWD